MLQIVKARNTLFYWCRDDGFTTRNLQTIRDHLTEHGHTPEGAEQVINEANKYLAEMEL